MIARAKSGWLLDHFWSKTKWAKNGCLEWTGGIAKGTGYGLFYVPIKGSRTKTVYAHRWLYTKFWGKPLSPKIDVMHSCDNRRCVLLNHLSAGTRKRNMEDAASRGRTSRGVGRSNAKLNDSIVRRIRRRYATGQHPQQALADQYGVHQFLISLVVRRKIWKHVK